MPNQDTSVEIFKEKALELVNSNYVLVDKKITELLKTIANSSLLYQLFEHVVDGFDYDSYKSVCFVDKGDGEKGKFTLPSNEKDVIAFSFLLLMDVDCGKIKLNDLLNDYFYKESGRQESYELFSKTLLYPFLSAVIKATDLLLSGDCLESEKEDKKEEVKVEKNKNIIEKEIEKIQGFALKNADEKDEILFVLSSLNDALENKDGEKITLCFTALKYFVKVVKRPKIDLNSIAFLISEKMR